MLLCVLVLAGEKVVLKGVSVVSFGVYSDR